MNPLDKNSPFNGPLTPHHFKQNQQPQQPVKADSSTTSSSPAKFVPLAVAGLALLILPITIWQINTQQDIRQRASDLEQPIEQNIIARFDNEAITDTDIDREYTKQQNATTYTVAPTSLRSKILDDVIRKKIILKEAQNRSISISEEEISGKISTLANLNPLLASNRDLIRDLLFEEKVAEEVSNSKIANIVFSENNLPQSESFFELIRSEALRQDLVTATTPYRQSRDVNLIENITITESPYLFLPETLEAIFDLEASEISEIIQDNNKLFIVEIISENTGEYESFEDFIQQQKASYVQIL